MSGTGAYIETGVAYHHTLAVPQPYSANPFHHRATVEGIQIACHGEDGWRRTGPGRQPVVCAADPIRGVNRFEAKVVAGHWVLRMRGRTCARSRCIAGRLACCNAWCAANWAGPVTLAGVRAMTPQTRWLSSHRAGRCLSWHWPKISSQCQNQCAHNEPGSLRRRILLAAKHRSLELSREK